MEALVSSSPAALSFSSNFVLPVNTVTVSMHIQCKIITRLQRLARCGSQVVQLVRQVIQYAVTAGCYVALLTNGYNLLAFRFEVAVEFVEVSYNPAPPAVHLTTNLVHKTRSLS